MSNFPASLDEFVNPQADDKQNNPSHAEQHANANDAIEAIEAFIGANGVEIGKLLNPIGTIREFNVSTNPATLLGFGTWSAFGTGRVTVAIDASQTEFNTNGKTGGAKTHTLTSSESGLPAHNHGLNSTNNYPHQAGSSYSHVGSPGTHQFGNMNQLGYTDSVSAANASSAHNNLQPYIVVYRWVRVS